VARRDNRVMGVSFMVQRLQAAPPRTQKRAQCGWFSFMGPDASARVDPSSNRSS